MELAEKQFFLGKRVKLQAGLQAYISLHCVEASSLVISTSGSNLTISSSDSKPSNLVLQVSCCDSKPSGSNLTASGCHSKPSDCSDSTFGSCLAREKPDETVLVLPVSGSDSKPSGLVLQVSDWDSNLTASGCDSKPSDCSDPTSSSCLATEKPGETSLILPVFGCDSKTSGLVLKTSGCDSKPSGSNLTSSSCDSKPSDCSDSTSGSCLATEKPDETGLVLPVSGCDSKTSGLVLKISGCDSKPSDSNLTFSGCDTNPSGCSDSISGSCLATEKPDDIRIRGQNYAKMAKELGDIAYGNHSDEAKVFEKICQQWNSTPSSNLFSVVQESITKLSKV